MSPNSAASAAPAVDYSKMSADAQEFQQILSQLTPILTQYISECERNEKPVTHSAAESPQALYAYLGELLDLPEQGNPKQLFPLINKTLECSVRTWSPRFMDKLTAGTRPIGAISELLIGILNTNVHVYHVSPVFTLMERNLIAKLGKLMGYKEGSGGFFNPGGSYSNIHAMVTARNFYFPEFTVKVGEKPTRNFYKHVNNTGALQVFCTQHSHYSVINAALTIGLTHVNIVKVAVDSSGSMIPEKLREAVQKSLDSGCRPFFVHMTAGTTVLGAFDPIDACSKICAEFGIWAHMDAAWGGAIAFSSEEETKKKLIGGSGNCDSITWNPHKLMGIPMLCSAFLVKHASVVAANSLAAGYLFHADEEHPGGPQGDKPLLPGYKPWDIGDGTIGCGRRPDGLKLYLTWVLEGQQAFTRKIDAAVNNARIMYGIISGTTKPNSPIRGSFLPVIEPTFCNVCFWYIPVKESWPLAAKMIDEGKFKTTVEVAKHLRETDPNLFHKELDKITKYNHHEVTRRAKFMTDYAPLIMSNGHMLPVFWRVVFINAKVTVDHIHALVKEIDDAGYKEEE